MPGWQHWYATHRGADVELLSVAVDVGGEDAVRSWTDRAAAQSPTVIDGDNRLGAVLGCQAIPNGVLLDPQGVIRYAKFGGFDVNHPDDVQAVEAAMREPGSASASGKRAALNVADQERVAGLLRGDGQAGGR